MRILLVPFAALLTLAPAVRAQSPTGTERERWQIQTEDGEYLWDIRLVRLNGDALVFSRADSLGQVALDQIRELRRIQKTTVRLDELRSGGNGAIAALTGADDEVYDFTPLDFAARVRALQQILVRYPVEGQ